MIFTMVSEGPQRVPKCNIAKHDVKWRHGPGIDGIYNSLGGSAGRPGAPRDHPEEPRGGQKPKNHDVKPRKVKNEQILSKCDSSEL